MYQRSSAREASTARAPVTAAESSIALPGVAVVVGKDRTRLVETGARKTHPLDAVVTRPRFDLVKVANVGCDGVGGDLIVYRYNAARARETIRRARDAASRLEPAESEELCSWRIGLQIHDQAANTNCQSGQRVF